MVPPTETAAWRLYEQCQLWWAQWGQVDYGLVHGDLTIKNLRYQGDVVSLFDFDGACMHWYGYELACFLHAFRDYPVLEQQRIAEALLAGYAQARPLPSAMPIQLPEFVQMKRLRSFLVLAHEWDFAALTPAQTKIVAHRRDQLIAGTVTVA